MPKDAPVNTGADAQPRGWVKVSGMQTKLHRWAVADPGRRFDDLFNLVYDMDTLTVAYQRVAGNTGARTAGVDGQTISDIEAEVGLGPFLEHLRVELKQRTYRPLPTRQRLIPKGSGKLRGLGIPTVADRVVQAAVKLVLEPIFEADFLPVSYGFRPNRRAHDAVAEIQYYGTRGYRWVLDADIEACFDRIDHTALMGRVRSRVKDKQVLALVRAFLKVGILTELGQNKDTHTGTPQGGILSPLLANIALSVLDEHVHQPWQPGEAMSTSSRRVGRRRRGLANHRIVRYADDFVVLVYGQRSDVEQIREQITQVLAEVGLVLSPAKTQVTHLSEGIDFLGFHIQWRRKYGTNQWHVYTFIADRPIRSLKSKIRALTRRSSQAHPAATLAKINSILRGWSNYFKHAVCKHTLSNLAYFTWWRIVRWWQRLHRWRWTQVKRWLRTPTGAWQPITIDGTRLFNLEAVPVTRYRYRGNTIPSPWAEAA